jgi:hypothetical protein
MTASYKEIPGCGRVSAGTLLDRFALLLTVSCLTAWAQSTAGISGAVADPSGAVIAGATVIVHHLDQHDLDHHDLGRHDLDHRAQQSATTDAEGRTPFQGSPQAITASRSKPRDSNRI